MDKGDPRDDRKRPRDEDKVFKYEGEILKSPLDKKEYALVELSNGLKVICISTLKDGNDIISFCDVNSVTGAPRVIEEFNSAHSEMTSPDAVGPVIDKAPKKVMTVPSGREAKILKVDQEFDENSMGILAISVGSGHMSDPDGYPGMAHLTEHAVFLGSSSNYPEYYGILRELDQTEIDDDGSNSDDQSKSEVNAHTDADETTYFLETPLKKFNKCAAHYCDLITSPTFGEEAVRREVNSVNAEYTLMLNNDWIRAWTILKYLSKEGHPYAKFLCGNDLTLGKPGLVTALREFKDQNYYAENMSAVIVAPWSIEKIAAFANEHLSGIPSAKVKGQLAPMEVLVEKWGLGMPFEFPGRFNKVIRVTPIYEYEQISLTWALPNEFGKDFGGRSLEFLAILFQLHSKGSGLVKGLKADGLITSLTCGLDSYLVKNDFLAALGINIEMTAKGMSNWQKVVSLMAQVMSRIEQSMSQPQNSVVELFGKWRQYKMDLFHYNQTSLDSEQAGELSYALHPIHSKEIPLKELISHHQTVKALNLDTLRRALGHLTLDRANILLMSRSFSMSQMPPETLDTEPYHNVIFSADPTPLDQFSNVFPFVYNLTDVYGSSGVITCPDNYELPSSNFTLIDPGRVFFRIYRSRCQRGMVPLTRYEILFSSDILAQPTPTTEAGMTLWVAILNSSINDTDPVTFDPFYNLQFGVGYGALVLIVQGSIPNLLKSKALARAIDLFSGIENKTSESEFEDLRRLTLSRANNILLDGPRLARDLQNTVLLEDYASTLQLAQELEGFTFGAFRGFVQRFRERMHIGGNILGCIPQGFSLEILESLKVIPFSPLTLEKKLYHSKELPLGVSNVWVHSRNLLDQNSTTTNFYSFGSDGEAYHMIGRRMSTEALLQLRAKEQLGYSIGLYVDENFGSFGINITIIYPTAKFTPAFIDGRIDAFLADFYQSHVQGASNEGLKSAYQKFLLPNPEHFRKLSIHVMGYDPKVPKKPEENNNGDSLSMEPSSDLESFHDAMINRRNGLENLENPSEASSRLEIKIHQDYLKKSGLY